MMCCPCECGDNLAPFSPDPEFYNVFAQIEDGPSDSYLTVYDAYTGDEVRFHIRYCPVCGRKLKEVTG